MSYIITTHAPSRSLQTEAGTPTAALEQAFNKMALGLGAVTITDMADGKTYGLAQFGKFLTKPRPGVVTA